MYFSIVSAKLNELLAWAELGDAIKIRSFPIFELPSPDEDWIARAVDRGSSDPISDFLKKKIASIGRCRGSAPFALDISAWDSSSQTKDKRHIISAAFSAASDINAAAIPCVNYSACSDPSYLKACAAVAGEAMIFRFDRSSMEDSQEPGYFAAEVARILGAVGADARRCMAVIDFDLVFNDSSSRLVDRSERVAELLAKLGFKKFCVAGGSIPMSVDKAVPTKNSSALVERIEFAAWMELRQKQSGFQWALCDYGIRSPAPGPDVPVAHANGKIRYTVAGATKIFRGQSKKALVLPVQQPLLASRVVSDTCFMGELFSAGDRAIVECSSGKLPAASLGAWIKIDTIHHVTCVVREIDRLLKQTEPAAV